jgi:hypothetical protein
MSRMHAQVLKLLLSGLAALGMALWVRYALVEQEGMALLCTQVADMGCAVRETAIVIFTQQRLGYFSLAAALLALIPRLRLLAWAGWIAGIAGLVLYCYEPSAPAVVLALLVLARQAAASNKQSASHA